MGWRHLRLVAVFTALAVLAIPAVTVAQSTPESLESTARIYALPGENVFPEGVAHGEGSNEFFVGATGDGAIFRGNLTTGEVTVFSPGGSDGRTVAIGMKVDASGRLVVVGGPTGMVFAYDTATGALITSASTGFDGQQFLNDVAIAPSGDAYITDSNNPILYRLPATTGSATPTAGGTLEPFLDFTGTALQYQEGFNLNGIVVSADGQYLVVTQTNTGNLYRIEISTKAVQQVDLGGAQVPGDGMVLDGSTLYAVNSGKITAIAMNDDLSSGTVIGDFADPSFSSPTTAAKVGSCLLVVNSQFANQGGTPQLPFTVSQVAIPSDILGEATPVAGGC